MKYNFYKYHGCGNDYIFFDLFEDPPCDVALIPYICDRHKGIGADGVVFIAPSQVAHGQMIMYNSDGSRGKMCGNALRCVSMHIFEKKLFKTNTLDILTDSGIKKTEIALIDDSISGVRCEIGTPIFDHNPCKKISTPWGEKEIICLSMGNPHCVIFENSQSTPFSPLASYISSLNYFPYGVNVEVVYPENYYRVMERGSGETLACGSGACAILAAGIYTGRYKSDTALSLSSMGGVLKVTRNAHTVLLEGDCNKAFVGAFESDYYNI